MLSNLELFAGAGGLALGLHCAGFDCIGLVENNKDCCETLRANMPKWKVYEQDIVDFANNLTNNQFEVDMISGGFPCQPFSLIGKKLGFLDKRGTVFKYCIDIVNKLKPKVVLLENVKGLQSHNNGLTLRIIKNELNKLGYYVDHEVLNAWHYDVAQKRERLIIICTRKDLRKEYMFPKKQNSRLTLRDALKDVPPSIGTKYLEKKKKVFDLVPQGGNWKNLPMDVAKEYMSVSLLSSGGRTGIAHRLSWDKPCLTLLTKPSDRLTDKCHPDETRPLTVREYARIQSFPDNWQFCGSMSSQYKQIGNAVPVNLAKHIGFSIKNYLKKRKKEDL